MNVSIYFPGCTSLSIDDVGVSRDTALRRYDRAQVLKPAISLKKVGGATVERLGVYLIVWSCPRGTTLVVCRALPCILFEMALEDTGSKYNIVQ